MCSSIPGKDMQGSGCTNWRSGGRGGGGGGGGVWEKSQKWKELWLKAQFRRQVQHDKDYYPNFKFFHL